MVGVDEEHWARAGERGNGRIVPSRPVVEKEAIAMAADTSLTRVKSQIAQTADRRGSVAHEVDDDVGDRLRRDRVRQQVRREVGTFLAVSISCGATAFTRIP